MDRQPQLGSVRRAREQAGLRGEGPSIRRVQEENEQPQTVTRPSRARTAGGAGMQQQQQPQQPRTQRPPPPVGLQTREGGIGIAISRPIPVVPQWPLASSQAAVPLVTGQEPYGPPAGKSQPPARPPRPSRVPSILDNSRVQDPTPVSGFQYRPQQDGIVVAGPSVDYQQQQQQEPLSTVPESTTSRPSTLSSLGTIPDFPLPGQMPAPPPPLPGPLPPPRRSVTLGPPPSARRGASSFYSNASFVSPIPEESLGTARSRSHTSFASSAAIPDSWGTVSPGLSPQYPPSTDHEEHVMGMHRHHNNENAPPGYEEDAEDSRLVRNASVGKRAKPTLVAATSPRTQQGTGTAGGWGENQGTGPGPTTPGTPYRDPFATGTGYIENSSSSSTKTPQIGSAITTDAILDAYDNASSYDQTTSSSNETSNRMPGGGGRGYSRFSAIRRPPNLDMDAVRKAQARGSLTSLSELIRRATRLEQSLENGKRPASRIDEQLYDEFGHEKEMSSTYHSFTPLLVRL